MPDIRLVVSIPDAAAAGARLERTAGDLAGLLAERIHAWGEEGLRDLQGATPVRTGHMQRSWTLESSASEATLANRVPYALFVLEGTPRHVIKGNPFLSFILGDRKIVRRAVQHPGTRGSEPLQEAIEKVVGRALDVGLEAAQDALVEAQ